MYSLNQIRSSAWQVPAQAFNDIHSKANELGLSQLDFIKFNRGVLFDCEGSSIKWNQNVSGPFNTQQPTDYIVKPGDTLAFCAFVLDLPLSEFKSINKHSIRYTPNGIAYLDINSKVSRRTSETTLQRPTNPSVPANQTSSYTANNHSAVDVKYRLNSLGTALQRRFDQGLPVWNGSQTSNTEAYVSYFHARYYAGQLGTAKQTLDYLRKLDDNGDFLFHWEYDISQTNSADTDSTSDSWLRSHPEDTGAVVFSDSGLAWQFDTAGRSAEHYACDFVTRLAWLTREADARLLGLTRNDVDAIRAATLKTTEMSGSYTLVAFHKAQDYQGRWSQSNVGEFLTGYQDPYAFYCIGRNDIASSQLDYLRSAQQVYAKHAATKSGGVSGLFMPYYSNSTFSFSDLKNGTSQNTGLMVFQCRPVLSLSRYCANTKKPEAQIIIDDFLKGLLTHPIYLATGALPYEMDQSGALRWCGNPGDSPEVHALLLEISCVMHKAYPNDPKYSNYAHALAKQLLSFDTDGLYQNGDRKTYSYINADIYRALGVYNLTFKNTSSNSR